MIQTDLGQQRQYKLQNVVCVYGDGSQAFATLHDVDLPVGGGQPRLRAAQALTSDFLHGLQEQLGVRQPVEVLPPSVLARTPEMIAWFVPAACRTMFFRTGDAAFDVYDGTRFPHPALVFKLDGRALSVRALARDERPTADTKLSVAPYFNVFQDGAVCVGSTRTPDRATVDVLDAWVASFFASAFSHAAGVVKLTTMKGGYAALVKSLAGSPAPFPARVLVDAKQTLRSFLAAGDRAQAQ